MNLYPNGSMVTTESNTYYIRNNRRYRVYSRRALASWALPEAFASDEDLSEVPLSRSPVGFRDGTLILNVADGRLYLISGNKRRHVRSPDVLERLNRSFDEHILVSQRETEIHEEGDPLD